MTREEAIFYLANLDRKYMEKGMSEALDMAIEALEQEPCDDCISREAVHDLMATWLSDYLLDETREAIEVIDAKVEDLPPVTPQPKTGHWKRISIDKYSEHAKYWYRCDKCGKDNLGNTDWCPNCGAKMVEPQERSG